MSLASAIAVARELAALSTDASALEAIEPHMLEEVLAHRETLIWRLRRECLPAVVATAPADERERLARLLGDAASEIAALERNAAAARDRVQGELSRLPPMRASGALETIDRPEPRFTERVA